MNDAQLFRTENADLDNDRLMELVEEISERLQDGKASSIEEFIGRHPEHADQLRQMLPTLKAMADLGYSSGEEELQTRNQAPRALGDFRIVRELGRGGMGVVYEAEQLSLGRTVALKVLPFASMLDERQRQRFKNEARAAATLDHPHIVSVYGSGEERGVHYYAMQLIRGHSIAEVIVEFRQQASPSHPESRPHSLEQLAAVLRSGQIAPSAAKSVAQEATGDLAPSQDESRTHPEARAPQAGIETRPLARLSTMRSSSSREFFRSAATLGRQAALALDHAHSQGIVHRDIKPANLMLDATGSLFVTDFGLARIENDPGMTMTGDLIGTLRYMSPEQALAKRVVVDHRSDIYSLGVTLYELLTLEPVYRGRDRQELMKQIAFEEPRPPTRINKSIPADLETIVLKAISKNPDDRYGTAQEMADDLQRHLEGHPIRASRAGPFKVASKWIARHRAVVATACITLFLALAVATVFVTRAYQRESRQRQLAANNAASAEAAKQRARNSLQLALGALNEMYLDVLSDRSLNEDSAHVPGDRTTEARWKQPFSQKEQSVLERARKLYNQLAAQNGNEPYVLVAKADAHSKIARMFQLRWQPEDALAEYTKCVAILQPLADQYPGESRYARKLGAVFAHMSLQHGSNARPRESYESASQAIALLEPLVFTPTADLSTKPMRQIGRDLYEAYSELLGACGDSEIRGEHTLSELQAVYRNADAIYPQLPWVLNDTHATNWASVLRAEGRTREAISVVRRWGESLLDDPAHREDFVRYGRALVSLGQVDAGEQALQKSIELFDQYYQESPKARASVTLFSARDDLLRLYRAAGKRNEAMQILEKEAWLAHVPVHQAHQQRIRWYRTFGAYTHVRAALIDYDEIVPRDEPNVRTWVELADLHVDVGHWEKAIQGYSRALELEPGRAVRLRTLAIFLATCPDASWRNLPRAVRLARTAVDSGGENYRNWNTLGVALQAAGDEDGAINAYEKAKQVGEQQGRYDHEDQDVFADKYAQAVRTMQKSEEQLSALEMAVQLLRDVTEHPHLGDHPTQGRQATRRFLARVRLMGALLDTRNALRDLGRHEDAVRVRDEAMAIADAICTRLSTHKEVLTRDANLLSVACNSAAWRLAGGDDPNCRHPRCAVALASLAVQSPPPDRADFWNTLGVALYREGRWSEAISALQRSNEIGLHGRGYNDLFLAMAQHQLGHAADARGLFDQAVTWMENGHSGDVELQAFRVEAADVLGLSDPANDDTSGSDDVSQPAH